MDTNLGAGGGHNSFHSGFSQDLLCGESSVGRQGLDAGSPGEEGHDSSVKGRRW